MDWDRDRKQYLRDYTKDKGENETRRIYEEEVRALSSNLTKQIERVKKLEKEKRESDNNRAKRMKNMESGVRAVGRSEQVRDVEKELRERIDTLTLSNKQKDEALRVKWSQAATDGVVAALAAAGVDSAPNRDGVFPDLSAERLKMPRHLRHSRHLRNWVTVELSRITTAIWRRCMMSNPDRAISEHPTRPCLPPSSSQSTSSLPTLTNQ